MRTCEAMHDHGGIWSIEAGYLKRLQANIATRARFSLNEMEVASKLYAIEADFANPREEQLDGNTAVVSITGPMSKRGDPWFGFTSTEGIRRKVEAAAANPAVKTILLRVDSPGGSVDGLAELTDAVYKARTEGKKRVIAQVEGMAASAAYEVVSQADEIVAGRMDLIGSIGTKLVLWDMSKMFTDMGIKPIPIDTGEMKSAAEPGTPITDEQVEYFRGIVNAYFADFQKAIQRGRSMSAAAVNAVSDGRVWLATEAKGLGLIDSIRTIDETLARVRDKGSKRAPVAMQRKRFELIY